MNKFAPSSRDKRGASMRLSPDAHAKPARHDLSTGCTVKVSAAFVLGRHQIGVSPSRTQRAPGRLISTSHGSGSGLASIPARIAPIADERALRVEISAASASLGSCAEPAAFMAGPLNGPRSVTLRPSGPISDTRSPSFRVIAFALSMLCPTFSPPPRASSTTSGAARARVGKASSVAAASRNATVVMA